MKTVLLTSTSRIHPKLGVAGVGAEAIGMRMEKSKTKHQD